jgi:cellulose synthase/poly-beta-1,6-N-acetylglucosamine synthase-like glycosyltransferase
MWWTKVIFFILSILAVMYMLLIFAFTEGWHRLDKSSFSHRNLSTTVTVVVPFRNEGATLIRLLQALLSQTFPQELLEIIFVNDHSEDDGQKQLEDFITQQNLSHVKVLTGKGSGKKDALRSGMLAAGGQLIVTTDADCFPEANWLTEMVTFYEEKQPRLILGPVVYHGEKSFLQKLFTLDFMSLVASGAGSAGLGLPFMGNAANMAFEKEVFQDADSRALQSGFASGDDVFFIHYVWQKYGRKAITFIKNEDVIVRTPPPANLRAFLAQRIRWGSKARAYSQPWALVTAYIIFLFNFLLTALLVTGFFFPWAFVVYGLFIALKTLTDFPLLFAYGRFSGKRHLLPLVFPFEIFYPVYITFVAFRGLFPYQWKNRRWNR